MKPLTLTDSEGEEKQERAPLATALKKRKKKKGASKRDKLSAAKDVGSIFTAENPGDAIVRGAEAGISLAKVLKNKKQK